MPDVTITNLPNATTPLSGTERVPMDQSGVTRDASTQDIANLAGTAITAAVAAHSAAANPHPVYLTQAEGDALYAPFGSGSGGATDAQLRDRATHTGTQAWNTITSTPTTLAGYGIADAQPLDSDLSAIAALSTTAFGRGLLASADAAALRTAAGLSVAVVSDVTGITGADRITNMVSLTQAEYNAITPNASTFYVIV